MTPSGAYDAQAHLYMSGPVAPLRLVLPPQECGCPCDDEVRHHVKGCRWFAAFLTAPSMSASGDEVSS